MKGRFDLWEVVRLGESDLRAWLEREMSGGWACRVAVKSEESEDRTECVVVECEESEDRKGCVAMECEVSGDCLWGAAAVWESTGMTTSMVSVFRSTGWSV